MQYILATLVLIVRTPTLVVGIPTILSSLRSPIMNNEYDLIVSKRY